MKNLTSINIRAVLDSLDYVTYFYPIVKNNPNIQTVLKNWGSLTNIGVSLPQDLLIYIHPERKNIKLYKNKKLYDFSIKDDFCNYLQETYGLN